MDQENQTPHKRRVRYKGKYPKKFEEKYKELQPEKYQDTIQHVIQKGNTPAGMHISIMVQEILDFLQIQPGHDPAGRHHHHYRHPCRRGHGDGSSRLFEEGRPGGMLDREDRQPDQLGGIKNGGPRQRVLRRNCPEQAVPALFLWLVPPPKFYKKQGVSLLTGEEEGSIIQTNEQVFICLQKR